MASTSKADSCGFTLIEMMIALGVGLIVLGAAVQLFTKSLNVTWIVSQRAELQQDARAAENLILRDVSLAGAGLPDANVALPSGTGVVPVYGCVSSSSLCNLGPLNSASMKYPTQVVNSVAVPYMYGVMPGCAKGVVLGGNTTDTITAVYTDTVFLLNDYTVTFNNNTGTSVTFTYPTTVPNPAPQNVTNTAVGLQVGDLILFQSKLGTGSSSTTGYAIGEVTTPLPAGNGPAYTVNFAASDPLLINQPTATTGNLASLTAGANTLATRVWVITYYIDNTLPDPSGNGAFIPRLMRQVNGRAPVPVAENVVNLQFTYDTFDANGNLLNASCDGGQSVGVSPNQIRRINLLHLTFHSQASGLTSAISKSGYQTFDMQTSMSARNLSFNQRY